MGSKLIYILVCYLLCLPARQQVQTFHLEGRAQGTTWQVTYFSDSEVISKIEIDSILKKIDRSLSLYDSTSLIVRFNQSHRGIVADPFLKEVVRRSLQITEQTGGVSDITIGPVVNAWGFGAKRSFDIPDSAFIKSLLPCIGSNKIRIKGDSLIKTKPCVAIDVNGIAQGYSVDIIAGFLESRNIENYLVELGGELRIKGKKQPSGQPFRIGVESPSADELSLQPMQKIVELQDGAITTSGNYRKFFESGGKKYNHIIDPRTGYPAASEMISVTIFADDAITADAFDNALMLMNVEQALRFTEARTDIAAFIVYRKPNGDIADTASARFAKLLSNTQKQNID